MINEDLKIDILEHRLDFNLDSTLNLSGDVLEIYKSKSRS